MKDLIVGKLVHYVLEGGRCKGEHRPAIVVRDWSNTGASYPDGTVNMQVFTDGQNDGFLELNHPVNVIWRTSIHHSEDKEPGTWHQIEKA